ncbi:hypothetical protein CHUAL_002110 [Chamberlinius hualienensis]
MQREFSIRHLRELSHTETFPDNTMPISGLPKIQPKTFRKKPLERPSKFITSSENKENFPSSNFSLASKNNSVAVKVNGLRNRNSNDLKQNSNFLANNSQQCTLQELSSQLGAKTLNKETRPITGEDNQGNLKNFFSQYPSLFTIDGEYVTITCYNSGSSSSSLNGAKTSSTSTEQNLVRPRVNVSIEAKNYFESKLELYGAAEVPLRSLLGHRSQAAHEIRQISGQNLKEFKDFICKFPDTFIIHNDFVILRKHWESICKQKVQNHRNNEEFVDNWSLISVGLDMCQTVIDGQGPTSVENLFNQVGEKLKLLATNDQVEFGQVVKTSRDLETLLKCHTGRFAIQNGVVYLAKKSTNSSSGTASTSTPAVSSSEPLVINSPTLVLTTSPNSVMSINHTLPSPSQSFKQRMDTCIKTIPTKPILDETLTVTLKEEHLKDATVKIIQTVKDCQNLVATLQTMSVISIAAEGINLGPVGPVTLFQIGTANGCIFILDIQKCRDLLSTTGIKYILESADIKKVTHDCRSCSAALYYQYGITLVNTYDTQAAHKVIMAKSVNKPDYKIKNISVTKLRRLYGSSTMTQAKTPKNKHGREQKYGTRRPLTEETITRAADNIFGLINVYETVNRLIRKEEDVRLFNQFNWEQIYCYIKMDEVKSKKKQRKLEREVDELKSKLSRMNENVVLSNREIRLLRFVNLNEQQKSKLEHSLKASPKLQSFQQRENYQQLASLFVDDDDLSELSDDEDLKVIERGFIQPCDLGNISVADTENGNSQTSHSHSFTSPSFEETIRVVEEFLANERLEKLGAYGTANNLPSEETVDKCRCNCHCIKKTATVACQTTSTADIVITKVYFEDMDDKCV